MIKKQLYRITGVNEAKQISKDYLKGFALDKVIDFGLPEVDDRYHIWRVPLLSMNNDPIGEIVIDAITSLINEKKSSSKEILESRLLGRKIQNIPINGNQNKNSNNDEFGAIPKISNLRNTIGFGDSEQLLSDTPNESIDLIFTSPPYFNARPEYADYLTYEEYLLKIKKIIHQCNRVLNEGRFFVMNISPILIRRSTRSEASKRIAVPFDFHRLFIDEGFEFIDDIHWVKPEGAGWATGRGRRFSADRNPLQYKAVPVTEYVLVYRKQTDKLIDWHIRKHPDQQAVADSKIEDGYETTNLWKIHPANHPKHPAVFPLELAEKVIKYYSFKKDVVLDPFAGTGTVGKAAVKLGRRFVLFEQDPEYIKIIQDEAHTWLHNKVKEVNMINIELSETANLYLNL
jgi:DNA modification methylase